MYPVSVQCISSGAIKGLWKRIFIISLYMTRVLWLRIIAQICSTPRMLPRTNVITLFSDFLSSPLVDRSVVRCVTGNVYFFAYTARHNILPTSNPPLNVLLYQIWHDNWPARFRIFSKQFQSKNSGTHEGIIPSVIILKNICVMKKHEEFSATKTMIVITVLVIDWTIVFFYFLRLL